MDSTMNYRFRRNVTGFVRWPYNWVDDNDNGNDAIIPLTPSQFDTANRAVRDDYPLQATAAMMDLIDSHDTNRALYVMTELGDTGLVQAKQRLELAALFQFTYIGAPTVFYGDEAAINAPSLYSGSSGPAGDPYTRAPYPWTDQPGNPGIYGPPDQNVLTFYTKLGHLRKQHPSLVSGTFVTLLTGDTQQPAAANTYAYARSISGPGGETAIVALNNGSSSNAPVIPVGAYYPSARFRGPYASDSNPQPYARRERQRLEQQLSGIGQHRRQRHRQRRQPDSLLGGWRRGVERGGNHGFRQCKWCWRPHSWRAGPG
jgi:glycosidase